MNSGGTETVLANLANEQVSSGHSVGVLSMSGAMLDRLDPKIVKVTVSTRRALIATLMIGVRSRRWDVVHVHQRSLSTFVALVGYGAKVQHVEHVHNVFPGMDHKWTSFRARKLIACGSSVAEMLAKDYGRDESRIFLVKNGVADTGQRAVQWEGGTFEVVNAARVVEQKNPLLFVEVLAQLVSRQLDVRGTWYGDGDLLPIVRQQIARRGLESQVSFPGPISNVHSELAKSHLLLLTSRHEGLPLTAIEAASVGLPIVATDVGSIRDIVFHNHNGYLVDDLGNAASLAGFVESLVVAEERHRTFGANSRRRFLEEFTLGRMSNDVLDVYEV
ncbi:glycosyltransferase [Klenkia soli]|nr:glycosyltransferase [Klenkia soli]